MTQYIYYPGCSVKSTGKVYEESLLSVFKHLDTPLEEIDDWNCCGATAYFSIDESEAFGLAARNLALAEKQFNKSKNLHIVAPCSACYLVLKKTQDYLNRDQELKQKIEIGLNEVGLSYEGTVQVRHPLDVVVNDIGLDKIKEKVTRPLRGLKVACYYGCQIVRPYRDFDHERNPMTMDNLVEALGGEPIDWPLKTRCCGGSLTGTIEEVGLRLSYIILREVRRRGADLVITTCPLCQFNLECYQERINKDFNESLEIPIIYFTQLMGLAFGISDKEIGIHRLFIPITKLAKLRKGGENVYV